MWWADFFNLSSYKISVNILMMQEIRHAKPTATTVKMKQIIESFAESLEEVNNVKKSARA